MKNYYKYISFFIGSVFLIIGFSLFLVIDNSSSKNYNNKNEESDDRPKGNFNINKVDYIGEKVETDRVTISKLKYYKKCLYNHNVDQKTQFCFNGIKDNNSEDWYYYRYVDDNILVESYNFDRYDEIKLENLIQNSIDSTYKLLNERKTTFKLENRELEILVNNYRDEKYNHDVFSTLLFIVTKDENNYVVLKYKTFTRMMSDDFIDDVVNCFVFENKDFKYLKTRIDNDNITGRISISINDLNNTLKKYELDFSLPSKEFKELDNNVQNELSFSNDKYKLSVKMKNCSYDNLLLCSTIAVIMPDNYKTLEKNPSYIVNDTISTKYVYQIGDKYYAEYLIPYESVLINYVFETNSLDNFNYPSMEKYLVTKLEIVS